MKIVLVSRFPADINKPRGGVQTATLGLSRALRDIDAGEIHIITLTRENRAVQVEELEGLTIHRLPRSYWPMFIDAFGGPSTRRLRRYLTELQPDIVHFHETWGFSSRFYPWPTVFTVHGFDSLNLPTESSWAWRLRSLIWAFAERVALKRQTHLISIAPYVRQHMEQFTDAVIYDIWNSLGREIFELERLEEDTDILFLGWINARKNPEVIVEATAQLVGKYPQFRVKLCGETSNESYANKLKAKIKALGLTDHVSMPGQISQPDVRYALQTSRLMILPSLQENAPMVVAEAMAAGVPVIASNVCGIPHMIEDQVSGMLLTDPHDASELAEKVDRLLSDTGFRDKMARAARQRASELFHPDNVAQQTLNVYRVIIDEHKMSADKRSQQIGV